ncbi:MAG TPA: EamA family transporter [Dissulfurispiraceae bacterium]
MRTAIIIAVIVLADSAHDIFLTRGIKQVGEVSTIRPKGLLRIAHKVLNNRNFLTGFFFTVIYFFGFLTALSRADLSFVFPATSLVYVTSTLGARFILRERITPRRWAGVVFICIGVALTALP